MSTPRRRAASRSILRLTWVVPPSLGPSMSVSSGNSSNAAVTLGAQIRIWRMSSPIKDRLCPPPSDIRGASRSCVGMSHNMPPGTWGAFSRIRFTTSLAEMPRSASGLSRTIMRELLMPLVPPELPITSWTAGSERIYFR